MSRKTFARLSVAGAATLLGGRSRAATGTVVVELFTSQGCSSCLPADALMAELGQRANVIAMSLHVDYWDYLGWRDTLGSPDCAERQRAYARRRGDGQVYTPQMIVNGRAEILGSDRRGVLEAIATARDEHASVPVAIESRERELVVEVAAAPTGHMVANATVWVIAVVPRVTIDIWRGENAGRTVAYTNVVRKIIPAGMWHGAKLDLSLPKQAIMATGATCAALLQLDGTGPITGAAWMAASDA